MSNASVEATYFARNVKYFAYDVWEPADARLSLFPSMAGGPWLILTLTYCYVYFARVGGSKLMKNRPSFQLKNVLRGYNLAMVIINSYLFYKATVLTRFSLETWGCRPFGQHPITNNAVVMDCFYVGWLFHLSKYIDWLDTVFFVLRKKEGQISTLHVFHHAMMPFFTWAGLKYVANLTVGFIPWINSFVHMVMYSYYGLSTLGPRVRPFLWWKKYLTQLQMVQISLVVVHCLHFCFIPDCHLFSTSFRAVVVFFASINLYLFYTFFRKSYVCTSKQTEGREKKVH